MTSATTLPSLTTPRAAAPTETNTPSLPRQRRDRTLYPSRSHYRCLIQRRLSDAMADAADQLAGGTLLDFGCGDMKYRKLFTPRVHRYLGIDLPGSPHADFELEADGSVPLPDQHADAVLSTQVLEHVDQPADYLAEARRLLRPGGQLILSTHGIWQYHPHPRDLWRWTAEGLTQTLETAGMTDIRVRGLMGPAATGVHLLQDGIYRRWPRRLRKPLFFGCQSLAAALDRDPDPSTACVLFSTCRRPETAP